ncbi:hypothetical protein [Sphingobium subterraneum]|uniref:Glycosyltransferase RgtA/B/C/D-like domain-containing protein n=1 Tax=Sphingobium subterraneum TaxID=627688 RepID=A0A841J8R8_9SPHN|nr:hypothetical protein [Sphingobium subterraneum]MBB6124561.1 hypothetical protein [Sphingobium subterraneum]
MSSAPSFTEPKSGRWIDRGRHAQWVLFALWLECVLVWMVRYWGSFDILDFRDPDDAMRLVQVRDFLNGQSWFDVSQHRVNPPFGGPMHWSRLLDLPIAGLIALFRPLLGAHGAEVVACVAVPLITLGILFLLFRRALRDFLGNGLSLFAIALLATSFAILAQTPPLRIDHHAWQIVMAAATMGGVLHHDPRKGGIIAALAMAMWLHISSEALPFAALVGGVMAVRYAQSAAEWPRLMTYMLVLVAGCAGLLLLTHGWTGSLMSYCDAMSPVYLAPLAAVTAALWIAHRLVPQDRAILRFLPAGVAGLAGAFLFARIGGRCLAGPFATLDPVVYEFWYKGVLEGLPIWKQDPMLRAIILLPSLAGIIGLCVAWKREPDPARRVQWLSLGLLAAGGLCVAILVMRSMSVAHLFALPGSAWMIAGLYARVETMKSALARVALVLPLCAISPAGLTSAAVLMAPAPLSVTPSTSCSSPAQIAALANMPTTTLFAPLDIGPSILLRTSHSVIGTGHHRNVAGIGKVVHAFLAPPDQARPIILSTSARYLLVCPNLDETGRYRKAQPNGLVAQLVAGHRPSWLTPVKVPGVDYMLVYRIER